MDVCGHSQGAAVSRRHYHLLLRQNTKMSRAAAAEVETAKNSGNSTAWDILQAMNELRQEQSLIDIQVEVSEAVVQ